MSDETKKEIQKTLLHWCRNAKRSQKMNYGAADYYSKLNIYFGVPVAILSTIIGTSVFITLESEVALGWKIATGLFSILAAVLSSLQTFLGFSDKAAKHRSAAAGYGAIKRELEQAMLLIKTESADYNKVLTNIRERLDHLAKDAPQPPKSIHDDILKELPGKEQSEYFPKYDSEKRVDVPNIDTTS